MGLRLRELDVVLVPGLSDSGPEHWQTRWQARLPNVRRLVGVDFDRPTRAAWDPAIAALVAAATRPVALVAHSLGVHAAVHAAGLAAPGKIVAGFLVAPPDAAALGGIAEIDPAFLPIPTAPLSFPSLLVASRDDPYAAFAASEAMAADWGAQLVDAGAAGHVNAASGHGPWPEGLMRFGLLLARAG